MAGSVSFELSNGILEFTVIGEMLPDESLQALQEARESLPTEEGPYPVIFDMTRATLSESGLEDVRAASDAFSSGPEVFSSRRALVAVPGPTAGLAQVASVVARVWHGHEVRVFTNMAEARAWVVAPPQTADEGDSSST